MRRKKERKGGEREKREEERGKREREINGEGEREGKGIARNSQYTLFSFDAGATTCNQDLRITPLEKKIISRKFLVKYKRFARQRTIIPPECKLYKQLRKFYH